MMASWEAHRHFFVFSLVQKMMTNQASSPSSTTSEQKNKSEK
jgi:hypothetical protein